MTSVEDKSTGVQLIRDFELDKKPTHLKCKQTIKNLTKKPNIIFTGEELSQSETEYALYPLHRTPFSQELYSSRARVAY